MQRELARMHNADLIVSMNRFAPAPNDGAAAFCSHVGHSQMPSEQLLCIITNVLAEI